MKRIKAFFYILRKSATSPSYYKDVINTSLGFSFKYFFVLALVVSVASGIASLVITAPKIDRSLGNLAEEVKRYYPEGLVVKVQNGELSINQPEPYLIKFPDSANLNEQLKKAQQNGNVETTQVIPENLIAFDSNGTLDSLEEYNTLILVNKANILTKNPDTGKIEVYPLKNIPDGEFSKATFSQIMDRMKVFINLIPIIYVVFITVFLFIYNFIFRILYALLIGVIYWIMSSFLKVQLSYTKHFKIALHVLTLPMLIETAKDIILPLVIDVANRPITVPKVPWFLAICVVFGFLALKAISKGVTQPVVVEQPKEQEKQLENKLDSVDTTKDL